MSLPAGSDEVRAQTLNVNIIYTSHLIWVLLHKLDLDICSLCSCRWWLFSYPAGRTARKESRSVKSINVSGDKSLFFLLIYEVNRTRSGLFFPQLGSMRPSLESRSDQTCFGKVVLWLKLPVFPPMTRTVKSAGGGFLVTPPPPPLCLPDYCSVCTHTHTHKSLSKLLLLLGWVRLSPRIVYQFSDVLMLQDLISVERRSSCFWGLNTKQNRRGGGKKQNF